MLVFAHFYIVQDCTQLNSTNNESSCSNEKGQILTIAHAGKESQFISLGSISGRAKIELLHETETAQNVSQVQALTMGRSTQTNKLHDDFLSLDIFGYQLSPIPMPKVYKFTMSITKKRRRGVTIAHIGRSCMS
jgi:hypothetical protein